MNQPKLSDMEQKVVSDCSDSNDSVGQSVIEHQDPISPYDSNGSSDGDPESSIQVDSLDNKGEDGIEMPVIDHKTDEYTKKGGRISKKQVEDEKNLVKSLFAKMTFHEILVSTSIKENKLMKYYIEWLNDVKEVPYFDYCTCYCKDLPSILEKMSKNIFGHKTGIKVEYKEEVFTITMIKTKDI